MHTPDELVGLYRARGYKITPQRLAIFAVLHGNHTHPTAEAVHEAVVAEMPNVSLRTVYSVLTELAEMGEILQLDLGTRSARFDPNVGDHHHLVCTSCGRVRDVEVEAVGVRPTGAVDDFVIDGTDIVFRGRCAECATRPV
ncbi:MAG: Fur family transcriptional regulator [Acidimicrobiales bacterium]